jgi:hypothetical protein
MKKILLLILITAVSLISYGQITISTIPYTYTQNFGTTDITSWTDNSTYSGWYATDVVASPLHLNITNTGPSNTGSFYTYECSGDNNQKIGSRASGGTNTIEYGVRFLNSSGVQIRSMFLDFDWYQMSIAGNTNNSNSIQVQYNVASPTITLATATYTTITSFTLPRDTSVTDNSNQLKGLPCNVGGHVTLCFDISSFTSGNEMMIKWRDTDNSGNDHHSAIDNVSIVFNSATCSALPIELLYFGVNNSCKQNIIYWSTATELNNDYFILERSVDAINFEKIHKVDGAGTATNLSKYQFVDVNPYQSINYYRLKQFDYNGEGKVFSIISSDNSCFKDIKIIKITNILGQEVSEDYNGIKIIFYSDGTIMKKM